MIRLLAPLLYLRISHSVTVWYSVIYPLIFAVPVGTFLARTALPFNVVGEGSLVSTFNAMLALLIGFFIAALALVAALNGPGMDKTMRGEGAKLAIPGRQVPVLLTRRMFLCLLFGYLTFVTLGSYLAFSVADVILARVSPSSIGWTAGQFAFGRAAFIYMYCFAIGHIMAHALLGVYYLAWRAVIADPEIVTPDEQR